MFIGGYQIVDFSKFPIDITNGNTTAIQVDRDFINLILNSRKPLYFTNISIKHPLAGKINAEGYTVKFIDSEYTTYKVDNIAFAIDDGEDLINIELILAD